MEQKDKRNWVPCPICGQKTRTKASPKTVLIDFPLYCPRCKRETIVNVLQMKITLSKEPDA